MDKITATKEAMRRSGSTKKLADHLANELGADPKKMLWRALRWRKYGIPPRYVVLVEQHTGVSRHDLDPEVFPRDAA